MKLNNEEMKEYLKQVVDLESSIYTQERSQEQAKRDLRFVGPTIEKVPIPKKKDLYKPFKPVRGELTKEQKEKRGYWIILLSFLIGLSIIFLCTGLYFFIESKSIAYPSGYWQEEITFSVTACMISVLLIVLPAVKIRGYDKALDDEFAKKTEQYEQSFQRYIESARKEEERYNAEMALYKEKSANYKRRYDEEYNISESNYKQASQLVAAFEQPLLESKSLLDRLYSLDYIFPKYRNMIAMCTIFEYYMTGRVSELEGPNGAYNLYESELRQNLIINKLDTIITQLEQVKENQFILYQEVQKTNKILNGISKDIKEILDTTKKIENKTELISRATNLTAYYSQIIAHNTEAIKYLELING